MSIDKTFFHSSFQKSLSDIYKDFYKSDEIEYLENELLEVFSESGNKNLSIKTYKPLEQDPLLRINLRCITIICKSMPFFAAKIRELFHRHDLEINRSLHFHPSEDFEFYYIEIQNLSNDLNTVLSKNIKDAYSKILKYTKDYNFLVNQRSDLWNKNFQPEYVELIQWLLKKGFVWEGSFFQSKEEEYSLGDFPREGEIWDWFTTLPDDNEETNFYARESLRQSYLNEGNLFYICFTRLGKKLILEGTFNQKGQSSAMIDIPLMKDRLYQFMKEENIQQFSGLGRTVRMVFNYIPTEILFLIPYRSYISIYSAIVEQSLKTNIRSNGIKLKENLGLIISIIPEKLWSEDKLTSIPEIIEKDLQGARIKKYEVLVKNYVQSFHLIRMDGITKQSLFQISSKLEHIFRPWIEHVRSKWEDRYKDEKFPEKLEFREDYRATHDPEKVLVDLELLRKLKNDRIVLRVDESDSGATELQAITHDKEFQLSKWVTALSHMGLSPISQRVYRFNMNDVIYAKTEFFMELFPNENNVYRRIAEAFTFTMKGYLTSDPLSGIILKSELDMNGIFFLKSIREYCLQTNPSFNRSDFNETLLNHPEFCMELWNYFFDKFYLGKLRSEEKLKELTDRAKTLLEDSVLTSMKTSTLAILRTSFFGIKNDREETSIGVKRKYVAYKIDSSLPSSLPDPRPYREIFVYSADFQGIHLRGGPVARGGLRFSDRISDFRTEILSLMKTQMVKNSVIVPVGSKGGFILTKNIFNPAELTMVDAYKNYIRSLISLTDNRIDGKEITFGGDTGPFAYDDYDPYLVVAADKGTAQLSDTANSLSIENNFWLGDAFASGGSKGYSHKAFGITAKGALVTADRHLRNLKIDFRKESITVAGIGDMGGDVFGNGLIESEHYKLIAAFNHKHIFLDPNPDPKKSYKERKRLFNSQNAGWDQYDSSLISKGGGVFNRSEKKISISPEVQKVLDITETTLSGQDLVKAILKAPVDLLYNGGIGTYVKSESEDNLKVGDPSNNDVRVNGNEIRARVLSEGGNLGLTQLGRIEYSLNGGRIYTDALDNSAGVDLSDHEVNLKIFFNLLLEKKKLKNEKERDVLLETLGQEVSTKVLRDNSLQSLSIETDLFESEKYGWNDFLEVTNYLIKKKILNPRTEKIPVSQHEWDEWYAISKGIPRPVLCVLLGYVKMDLYNDILSGESVVFKKVENIYFDYFPEQLIKKYSTLLTSHPLLKEILTTQIVNFFVNLIGIKSALLLELDKEGKDKKFLEILYYANESGLYDLLNELSLIRDKERENEIVQIISGIRSRINKKFEKNSLQNNLFDDKIINQLSDKSIVYLQKIFE